MTNRTPNKTILKRLRNQAVEVTFDGGTLTTDAGLLLLRELDQRLKLIERITRVIPDPRDPLDDHVVDFERRAESQRAQAIECLPYGVFGDGIMAAHIEVTKQPPVWSVVA
jgi:hypothetical protein